MVRVGFGSVYRADFRALGRFVISHALHALFGVDDIDCLTLADGLHGTLGLAGSAADALIRNFISHSIYLLILAMA